MKKIKVLQAIRQGKIGGGESHVLELASNLDKNKFETVVLSFTEGEMIEELKHRNVRTQVIESEKAFDFTVWNKVKEFMVKERFDIVHAHGTRANSNVLFPAKANKLPVLYTVHGWSFHKDQKFPIKWLRTQSERFLTQKANHTICVSKSNEQEGREKFNLNRSSVIFNAVDFNRFSRINAWNNLRNSLKIDSNEIVIGFIARITEQKSPLLMLEAFQKVLKKHPNVTLLMVGDGNLKNECISYSRKLKIDTKVIFEPFRTDIPEVLKAIDIYCLPSLWEGFPIGIIEAMAMKVPVICSSVDGNKELVKHLSTGLLLKSNSSEQLAFEIERLIINKNLGKKMATNAYEIVKQQYAIENQVFKIEKLYQGLTA